MQVPIAILNDQEECKKRYSQEFILDYLSSSKITIYIYKNHLSLSCTRMLGTQSKYGIVNIPIVAKCFLLCVL